MYVYSAMMRCYNIQSVCRAMVQGDESVKQNRLRRLHRQLQHSSKNSVGDLLGVSETDLLGVSETDLLGVSENRSTGSK